MMITTRSSWLPILGLLVCACVDEQPEPWKDALQFEWHGEYVSVYGYDRDIDQVCGETLAVTDRHAEAMMALYGVDVPVHVDYHWFSRAYWQETEDMRPCAATSCSYLGAVHSPYLAYAHEIAHGVTWDADGHGNSTLSEGIAEYLASSSPHVSTSSPTWPPVEHILAYDETTDLNLAGDDYEQAGHFVSFLVDHHGFEAVRHLYRTVPADASLADWDAAMRDAVGLSLPDVIADYSAYPVCSHHGYRARLLDCEGEADLELSDTDPTHMSFRIACDETEPVGEHEGRLMVVKRVYAPTPMWYRVEVEVSGGASTDLDVVLEQCAACSESPYVASIVPTPPKDESNAACVWIESPRECGETELSGLHAFIFFLPADLAREIEVIITPTNKPL